MRNIVWSSVVSEAFGMKGIPLGGMGIIAVILRVKI
jgi:hypothetical protein